MSARRGIQGGERAGRRASRRAAPAVSRDFDQMYPMFAALRASRPRHVDVLERAFDQAREFRARVVEPNALELERRMMENPRYVAEDLLAEAARRRLFTSLVPKLFGGLGLPFGAVMLTIEEISAGCVGIANLLAVHGLAITSVAATGDLAGLERVSRALVESERAGRPKLLSTGITEPGAGTDTEDADFLATARITCEATPVAGGYRLNGRKIFISNGSIAATHVVYMPTDRRAPVETTFVFLVEEGTPGFSIGRVERKMGQKACPAAELVFEDCFVPERQRLGKEALPGRRIDLIFGATRGGVGAFAAGVARGALERARAFAETHRLGARPLIGEQWVQMRLAQMHMNAELARMAYVSAMLQNELFGLMSLMQAGALLERLPARLLASAPVKRALGSRLARERVEGGVAGLHDWQVAATSASGAVAKAAASDLAVENCGLALDILGASGLRHDAGVEKLFRDAKLLQIYEGTNQLNRVEIFKKALGGAHPR